MIRFRCEHRYGFVHYASPTRYLRVHIGVEYINSQPRALSTVTIRISPVSSRLEDSPARIRKRPIEHDLDKECGQGCHKRRYKFTHAHHQGRSDKRVRDSIANLPTIASCRKSNPKASMFLDKQQPLSSILPSCIIVREIASGGADLMCRSGRTCRRSRLCTSTRVLRRDQGCTNPRSRKG